MRCGGKLLPPDWGLLESLQGDGQESAEGSEEAKEMSRLQGQKGNWGGWDLEAKGKETWAWPALPSPHSDHPD